MNLHKLANGIIQTKPENLGEIQEILKEKMAAAKQKEQSKSKGQNRDREGYAL